MSERPDERWFDKWVGLSTLRVADVSPSYLLRWWLLGGSGPGLTPQLGSTCRTSSTRHHDRWVGCLRGRLALGCVAACHLNVMSWIRF
jgi:hypothetical protein